MTALCNQEMDSECSELVAQILNCAWMVRHYSRGGRCGIGAVQRQQAILYLGNAVRHAFTVSDDFEALLEAVVEGLRPKDRPSSF